MFHYIDRIVRASDETLVRLAADARHRAETSDSFQYRLNQGLIANACERELKLRKANKEGGAGVCK